MTLVKPGDFFLRYFYWQLLSIPVIRLFNCLSLERWTLF